jgi:hypothetical protein
MILHKQLENNFYRCKGGTVTIDPLFDPKCKACSSHRNIRTRCKELHSIHIHLVNFDYRIRHRLDSKRRRPVEEVRAGDVVLFDANEKHWHGASATKGMSHIVIQENLSDKVVDWMEKVSDKECNNAK